MREPTHLTSLQQIALKLAKLLPLLSSDRPGEVVAAADAISRVIDFINRHHACRAARHLAIRLRQLQEAVRRDPLDTEAHSSWLNVLIAEAELLAQGSGHNACNGG